MALVVEDGSGLPNADSYISLMDADAYFADHGSPVSWMGLTDPNKESALRYAVQRLDARAWIGVVSNPDAPQALAWPRVGGNDFRITGVFSSGLLLDNDGRAIAGDVVPQRVKDAQCELALAHLQFAINQQLSRGGEVKRDKVGPIEVEYMDGAPGVSTLPYIVQLLRPLIAMSQRLIRA